MFTMTKEVQEAEIVQPKKPTKTKQEKELEVKASEIRLEKTKAVATTKTKVLDPIAFAQMNNLAQSLIAGGAASRDADTPEKLVVKLQAGYELGMQPVESLNSLYIVNGRVTIWGSALIKRLRTFGWSVSYKDESQEQCTIVVTKDGETIEDTFLYADAVASGYTNGAGIGWKAGQNRKLKMRYGAASQLVKTYLPEVLGTIAGIKEVDEDAPTIESERQNAKAKLLESLNEDN